MSDLSWCYESRGLSHQCACFKKNQMLRRINLSTIPRKIMTLFFMFLLHIDTFLWTKVWANIFSTLFILIYVSNTNIEWNYIGSNIWVLLKTRDPRVTKLSIDDMDKKGWCDLVKWINDKWFISEKVIVIISHIEQYLALQSL